MSTDPYPTTSELLKVREWKAEDGWPELLSYVKTLWWAPDITWSEARRRTRDRWPGAPLKRKYYVSTGGWSGNEDLISALSGNWLFWAMCWEQSNKGGHYIFEADR